MIVQYQYITWSPPNLSEAEEVELGRQIALVGREHFVREFRKSIGKTAASVSQARHPDFSLTPQQNNSSPVRKAFKAIDQGLQWAGVFFILGLIVVGIVILTLKGDWGNLLARVMIAAIPVIIVVVGIYLASVYLATQKFEKWIDHLVARYAAYVARGGS